MGSLEPVLLLCLTLLSWWEPKVPVSLRSGVALPPKALSVDRALDRDGTNGHG